MGRGSQTTEKASMMSALRGKRHQSTNAVAWEQLGFTAEDIDAAKQRTQTASFTAAYTDTPDGLPIPGIVYQTDYRAEEEYGISDLRKALTTDNPRQFVMSKKARAHVRAFDDANGLVLSVEPLPDEPLCWGDKLRSGFDQRWGYEGRSDYRDDFNRSVDYKRGGDQRKLLVEGKVSDLRSKARELGITPLPSSREGLREALRSHPDFFPAGEGELWPAWFHNGKQLVLRADGDGMTARIVGRLRAAAEAGTLAIGSASGPFHSGIFFYDARDETPGLVAEREEAFDWHDARMEELQPVLDELKAKGYSWYFLGRPSLIATKDDPEKKVRYWLNGETSSMAAFRASQDGRPRPTRSYKQPFGWYTLDELRAEKFVDDFATD